MRSLIRNLLVTAVAVALTGCFDPPTGEIGLKLTDSGDVCSCLVMVFNDQGRQIQEVPADQLGVAYIEKLIAGTYTLKFKGSSDSLYPAVRTVTIGPDESAYLEVDVSQPKDPHASDDGTSGGAAPAS
jgi:hypothetical protein